MMLWWRGAFQQPQRQRTWVQIPPWYTVFRKNKAMLLCVFVLICIICELKKGNEGIDQYKLPKKTFRDFLTDPMSHRLQQGCQMVYFQTENSNLGKFWRVLQWKMLVFLWPFGLFYGRLVNIVAIGYILWSFWYIFPHCTKKNLATLVCSLTGT
jgi:hypothetical protein